MFKMTGSRWIRPDLLVAICLLATLGYFAWQGIWSPMGVAALDHLEATKSKLELHIASLQTKRQKFEARVSLMRQESLDPDMLDEMARVQLGLLGPNDFLVHLKH
jgi:cell division protein FtsB